MGCKIRVSERWGEEEGAREARREMPEKHRRLKEGEENQQMRKYQGGN